MLVIFSKLGFSQFGAPYSIYIISPFFLDTNVRNSGMGNVLLVFDNSPNLYRNSANLIWVEKPLIEISGNYTCGYWITEEIRLDHFMPSSFIFAYPRNNVRFGICECLIYDWNINSQLQGNTLLGDSFEVKIKNSEKVFATTVSLSFLPMDKLCIGVDLNLLKESVFSNVGTDSIPTSRVEGSGHGYTWNFGFIYLPRKWLSIGGSIRPENKIYGNWSYRVDSLTNQQGQYFHNLPLKFEVGLAIRISTPIQIAFSFDRTYWMRYENSTNILNTTQLKDVDRFHFGLEYRSYLSIRFGFYTEPYYLGRPFGYPSGCMDQKFLTFGTSYTYKNIDFDFSIGKSGLFEKRVLTTKQTRIEVATSYAF